MYRHGSCYFIVKLHLSCAIALFCISLGIPGKLQAAVRLHGLARSLSGTSLLLLQGAELPENCHDQSSSAAWLGAEQPSGTDTALIWVLHASVMSFHFQREVAGQARAQTSTSAVPGNLSRSGAAAPFQM